MTQNYYFFKTVKADGRSRLRPLEGQEEPSGRKIETSLNVQADASMRASYPLGTTFVSDTLELRVKAATPFYSAARIYPVGIPNGDYLDPSHKPTPEMVQAWRDYQASRSEVQDEQPDFGVLFNQSGAPANPSTLLQQLKADSCFAVPTIKQDGFFIDEKDWYLLIRNIASKVNTMMIGPSGTGKTELVMLACRKLGIDCHVYDMGSMYDPVAGLLGVHRLQKGGESVFDYAQFTQDIQKPGVILLDELSRAPVTTNNILFPCLDSRRMLPVEMAGGNEMRSIQVHPDCVFIATANVGVEYTGTMSLDRALVGRFFPLELDYMPEQSESEVLMNRWGIGKSDAENIVSVAQTVRNLYNKQELSCTISTRETLAAARLVADGWSALDAMELTFLPLFEGTKLDGERSVVSKIFMTR